MSSDLQTQILTTWLPLLLMLVLGVIGLLRGAVREAIVASMVALGAFVNSQWAIQWGQGLNQMYNGWPQQGEQFVISLLVLWAIAIIVGYGLGSLLPRQPITAQSRAMGFLLGLVSGAALAGWSLRYYITNTDGTLQPDTPPLLDPVSRSLIIWATWFPLVLVLLGTLVVLIGPLRRAQSVVAQPSDDTNWSPAAPARTPAGSSATTSTVTSTAPLAYAPIPHIGGNVASSQPTSPTSLTPRSVAPPYPPPPGPPYGSGQSGAVTSTYDAYPQYDSSRTRAFTPQPEPPTARLPTREVGSGQTQVGAYTGPSSARVDTAPDSAGAGSDSKSASADTAPNPTFDTGKAEDSSWLLQAVDNANDRKEERAALDAATPAANEEKSPGAEASTEVAPAERTQQCPNCGSSVIPGASFCTNCGTRLTQD